MPVLEAEDLDELQLDIADIFAEVMPDMLFIQRTESAIRDEENPEIIIEEVENKVYDEVPCAYNQIRPAEKSVMGLPQTTMAISIKLAPIYDIRPSDSGQIYEKGQTPAINFEVIGVEKDSNATECRLLVRAI